jgi:RNA polymerase sigma factor (TIGR02999 family)
MSDLTRILSAIEAGDPSAADQLLPLVYEELRKLAAQRLTQENPGQTLQATALVHEAYLRLVAPNDAPRPSQGEGMGVRGAHWNSRGHFLAAQKLAQEKPGQTLQATALVHEAYLRLVDTGPALPWNSRGHFFAAAAEAMRRILVEQARRRHAAKRGGQLGRDALQESAIAAPSDFEETLAINDLLDHFATIDPVAANLVKLRCFVGLTMEEIAEALDISVRSAYDTWAYARAWLHRHLR